MHSSAPCAAGPPGPTSGRGVTGCSRRPIAPRRTRSESTTRTSFARCAPPGTRPSASSTTSAPPRPLPQRTRQRQPGSRSSCSTSPTSAAASTACASRASLPTSRRSKSLRAAGIAVGVAPHSVRACSRAWLEEIGAYATREGLPLHIHADEQPREIQECLEEHGCRPIELLADTGCLGERTTIIHATHANDDELDLLAATGARICACPTTESDLGDGFLRVDRGSRPLDPALHRVGLEHADRPARGAARARGDRAPPDRPPRDPHHGAAARDRLGRGSASPAPRGSGRRSRSTRGIARSPALRPSMSRLR